MPGISQQRQRPVGCCHPAPPHRTNWALTIAEEPPASELAQYSLPRPDHVFPDAAIIRYRWTQLSLAQRTHADERFWSDQQKCTLRSAQGWCRSALLAKTCGHFKLGTSCARELEEQSSAETFFCIYLSITCFRVSFVRSFVRCTASQETRREPSLLGLLKKREYIPFGGLRGVAARFSNLSIYL